MPESATVSNLKQQLNKNHAFALQLAEADFPLDRFLRVQSWQQQRLARSYADLRAIERYQPATDFFLQELYGGLDFRKRDQEVARVLPIMNKLLPDHLLDVLAEALELQHLSLSLDRELMENWLELPDAGDRLDVQQYAQAYHATADWSARVRQIELIETLGMAMNKVVKGNLVHRLIRLLRRPAKAAGFSELQRFLEQGLAAFHRMGDATEFVDTIVRRERKIMESLKASASDIEDLPGFEAVDYGQEKT